MLDLHTRLRQMNCPKLLAQAARFGLDTYRRGNALQRHIPGQSLCRPAATLMTLLEIEQTCQTKRHDKAAYYQIIQHIDVLTAIMAEARLLQDTSGPRGVA